MTDLLGDDPAAHVLRLRPAGTNNDGPNPRGHGENWMNLPFLPRLALAALIPAAAIWLGIGSTLAQAPSAAPTASASESPAPAPAASTAPAASPAPAPSVQTADPFGEQITRSRKKVVVYKDTANWDSAFDSLVDAFKKLNAVLD